MSVAGWLLSLLCISAGAVYDEAPVLEPDDDTDDQRRMVQMLLQMDILYHGGKHNQSHLVPDCTLISTPKHPVSSSNNAYDFARHNVKCPASTYMKTWKLVVHNQLAFFEVQCCKVPGCVSVVARTDHKIELKDGKFYQGTDARRAMACEPGELLQQWGLVRNGDMFQMETTCCRPIGKIEDDDCKPQSKYKKSSKWKLFTNLRNENDCGDFGENYGLKWWSSFDNSEDKHVLTFMCCRWSPPPTPSPTPNPTPSPTPNPTPPPCTAHEPECKLDLSNLVSSASQPGTGKDNKNAVTLRFAHVCTVAGVSLDLNVTFLPGYHPQIRNEVVGTFYKITMKEATQANLRLTFVKSGTLTPHIMRKVALTVFGLDNGLDGSLEFVGTSDYSRYSSGDKIVKLAPKRAARAIKPLAGEAPMQVTFGSLQFGNTIDGYPISPTSQIVQTSVVLEYCHKASWVMGFGVTGKNPARSRAFYLGT